MALFWPWLRAEESVTNLLLLHLLLLLLRLAG